MVGPLSIIAALLIVSVAMTDFVTSLAAAQPTPISQPPLTESSSRQSAESCGDMIGSCDVVSARAANSSAEAAWWSAYATIAGAIIAFLALGAAVAGVFIALRVGIGQMNATRAISAVDHALRLATAWNSSDYLRKRRRLAEKLIKDRRDLSFPEAWQVAEFLESVGRLTKLGVVNNELIWANFSYSVLHYYPIFRPSIEEARTQNPLYWECFEYLYREIGQHESELGGTDHQATDADLDDFLDGELRLIAMEPDNRDPF
jgi:hypothetical protein